MDAVGQVHIAGVAIQVGTRYRQRCAFCGALLNDYDLANMGFPEGQDMATSPPGQPAPSMWEVDALVRLEGVNPRMSTLVEPEKHEDGTSKVPEDCCALLDPEVTA